MANIVIVLRSISNFKYGLHLDKNYFQADTASHHEEFISKTSTEVLLWFQRRCNNGENQSWLPVAIFVDSSEPFLGRHNKTTMAVSLTV